MKTLFRKFIDKKGDIMSWHPYSGRYENMQYRYCGKSGLRLPALSLGLWHSFGHVQALDSQRALLRKAFDLGITHFDLANNYGPPAGSAEENFGRLLREDFAAYRDELIISTKAGYDMWPGPYGSGGSRKYLLASLDQSLKRMGVEYVDIFYSHRVDENTPMEETASALAQAVQSGKALYVGISSYSTERTQKMARCCASGKSRYLSTSRPTTCSTAGWIKPGCWIPWRKTAPAVSPLRRWRRGC
jgi:L-glyceraldehyde 3-phosphate reductase